MEVHEERVPRLRIVLLIVAGIISAVIYGGILYFAAPTFNEDGSNTSFLTGLTLVHLSFLIGLIAIITFGIFKLLQRPFSLLIIQGAIWLPLIIGSLSLRISLQDMLETTQTLSLPGLRSWILDIKSALRPLMAGAAGTSALVLSSIVLAFFEPHNTGSNPRPIKILYAGLGMGIVGAGLLTLAGEHLLHLIVIVFFLLGVLTSFMRSGDFSEEPDLDLKENPPTPSVNGALCSVMGIISGGILWATIREGEILGIYMSNLGNKEAARLMAEALPSNSLGVFMLALGIGLTCGFIAIALNTFLKEGRKQRVKITTPIIVSGIIITMAALSATFFIGTRDYIVTQKALKIELTAFSPKFPELIQYLETNQD